MGTPHSRNFTNVFASGLIKAAMILLGNLQYLKDPHTVTTNRLLRSGLFLCWVAFILNAAAPGFPAPCCASGANFRRDCRRWGQ